MAKILFVHNNFPGRFEFLLPSLKAAGHQCFAIAQGGRQADGVPLLHVEKQPLLDRRNPRSRGAGRGGPDPRQRRRGLRAAAEAGWVRARPHHRPPGLGRDHLHEGDLPECAADHGRRILLPLDRRRCRLRPGVQGGRRHRTLPGPRQERRHEHGLCRRRPHHLPDTVPGQRLSGRVPRAGARHPRRHRHRPHQARAGRQAEARRQGDRRLDPDRHLHQPRVRADARIPHHDARAARAAGGGAGCARADDRQRQGLRLWRSRRRVAEPGART